MPIHPTAIIDSSAKLDEGVTVGPYCVIGADVVVGKDTTIGSHTVIDGPTTIGAGNKIGHHCSLGGAPQDLSYKGEPTKLVIGNENFLGDYVQVSRGSTKTEHQTTTIGNKNFLMAYCHVGHDCIVGDDVIFATSATLGGHCVIGDFVFIGGLSAVHQFTRIGSQVMIGGVCGVRGDIIPYGLVNGQYARLEGLNIIGMRRRKFTRDRLAAVRAFYQKLFHGPGVFAERLAAVQPMAADDPAIAEILAFIAEGSHRALCLPGVHGDAV